jgi:hypothetical protein
MGLLHQVLNQLKYEYYKAKVRLLAEKMSISVGFAVFANEF